MSKKVFISVVSPVYMAEGIIHELVKRIKENVTKITPNYEIILVEDNSPDESWQEIEIACQQNKSVKGLSLSRNFGQHAAISAGLETASGEYVVVMDCDLQHNPSYIFSMYQEIINGYDIVLTKTKKRRHSIFKNSCAFIYYKFLDLISDYDMDPNIGSLSMLKKKVVNSYIKMQDHHKAYLWALKWLGFETKIISIDHDKRFSGQSSYSFAKLVRHALNVTVSNSNKLLHITTIVGFVTSFIAASAICYIFVLFFRTGSVAGWPSLMVTITFFSGLNITAVGIIGIYISKIFEQTKNRPHFVISKSRNISSSA